MQRYCEKFITQDLKKMTVIICCADSYLFSNPILLQAQFGNANLGVWVVDYGRR